MLKKVRLLAVVPVLVLALSGCAAPKVIVITQSAAAAPTQAAPATSLPPFGSLDSEGTPTPPPPIKAADLIKAKGPEHSFVKEAVESFGYTKSEQKDALDFGRSICDDEVQNEDDQDDAISAAEGDSGVYDGSDVMTEQNLALMAEQNLCPNGKMNPVTKKFLKGEEEIKYTVTSSSGVASMTWDDGGTIGQDNDHSLPYSKTFDAGQETSMSAQNGGGGTITCTTTDGNGKFQNKHKSTGAYASVDC